MLGKQRLSGLIKATALLALSFLLPAASARADVVTNLSPDWVIVAGSLSATGGIWALPASSATCGTENELSCEPTGTFVFDHPITTKGYFTITDQDGTISDYLLFSNNGAGGNGLVQFYSDPNLSPDLTGFTNDGSLCTEDAASGCNSATFGLTLTDGTIMTITGASDGEAVFDPFGFGVDTSDQIKFACSTNCQLVNNVPEPGSLSLLLTMLVAGGIGASLFSRASRKSRPSVGVKFVGIGF